MYCYSPFGKVAATVLDKTTEGLMTPCRFLGHVVPLMPPAEMTIDESSFNSSSDKRFAFVTVKTKKKT